MGNRKTTSRKSALEIINSLFEERPGYFRWLYRRLDLIIFLLIAMVLITVMFAYPPQRRGDGNEYFQMMISLGNHASPDLRDSDTTEYKQLRLKAAKSSSSFRQDTASNMNLSEGYVLSSSGKPYSVHFWLYSLTAVPAYWCLKAVGLIELKAFQITNALFVIFALALIMFSSGFNTYKRWLFSVLILTCPAIWYLGWPQPEVFSFSMVVASIALFTRKKYSLAVLCAALASAQNPPIIILVIFFLAYGLAGAFRTRRFIRAVPLVSAALPVLFPIIFNYVTFGTPNLIFKVGAASFSVISFSRTLSFFFDLNQGILPYMPGVLVFFIFLLFRNWRTREWRVYEILLTIVLMALLANTTLNWNSDSVGIMRYTVWILPLLIWGSVAGANLKSTTDRIFLAVALISQVVIVFSFPSWFIVHGGIKSNSLTYVENNVLARYFLDNHPNLYNPEPEIFTERTLKKEVPYNGSLPILYIRDDGNVTKILTNYEKLGELDIYGDVDQGFLQEEMDRHRGDSGVFYINLSPGEMRISTQNTPLSSFSAEITVDQESRNLEANTMHQELVKVKNTGLQTWLAYGDYPIQLTYDLFDEQGNTAGFSNLKVGIKFPIRPGDELSIPINILIPPEPGNYFAEFDMVQQRVTSFKNQGSRPAVMRIVVQ